MLEGQPTYNNLVGYYQYSETGSVIDFGP